MPRWKLHDCPRCGGDLFMDAEEDGWLRHCLQCGFMARYSEGPETSLNPVTGIGMPVSKAFEEMAELSGDTSS